MSAEARWVCERCGHAFDGEDARCPKCLRKSGVRSDGPRDSAAARLAEGDHSQTDTGRRATAIGVAVAAIAAIGVGISLVWSALTDYGLVVPVIVAAAVAAITWVAGALAPGSWAAVAARFGAGAVLAVWALVCAVLAMGSGTQSIPFMALVGGVLFVGGVVPVLAWMRRGEEPAARAGKWR